MFLNWFTPGPAVHLVNLIPPAASLAPPSVSLVHEMLVRANLPLDTVALAVCILDSLNARFSLNWRLLCPLARREVLVPETSNKRHTFSASPAGCSQLHIDCVNPEVIVLAALVIAVKFLEDWQEPTQYYRLNWGNDLWSSEQINVTERCIMESLDYHILPLWDPRLIADALSDMGRAGKQALLPSQSAVAPAHTRSISTGGKATFGLGMQLTPVETPASEKGPGRNHVSSVVNDGRMSDALAGPSLVRDSLHIPMRMKRKSFYDSD